MHRIDSMLLELWKGYDGVMEELGDNTTNESIGFCQYRAHPVTKCHKKGHVFYAVRYRRPTARKKGDIK